MIWQVFVDLIMVQSGEKLSQISIVQFPLVQLSQALNSVVSDSEMMTQKGQNKGNLR
jgi:hypothetical protein